MVIYYHLFYYSFVKKESTTVISVIVRSQNLHIYIYIYSTRPEATEIYQGHKYIEFDHQIKH